MFAPRALKRLKAGTDDLHAQAERHVRILDADATDDVYRRYLERMYGFHAPLEARFAGHAPLAAAGFAAEQRTKASLLVADLARLGVRAATLPCCAQLPVLGDLARGIGVAYVIEGSTLGGRFILTHMRPALGHLIPHATSFLAGYGALTGPMWKQFASLCERLLVEDGAIDRAVVGARDTFAAMIGWLGERELDPPHPYLRASVREVAS